MPKEHSVCHQLAPSKEKPYHNIYKRTRSFDSFLQTVGFYDMLSEEQVGIIKTCHKYISECFYNSSAMPRRFMYNKYILARILDFCMYTGTITSKEHDNFKKYLGKIDSRTRKSNDELFNSIVDWKGLTTCATNKN